MPDTKCHCDPGTYFDGVETMATPSPLPDLRSVEVPMPLSEFVSYLRDTVPNLLGGSESEISSALSLDESVTTLTKFAAC